MNKPYRDFINFFIKHNLYDTQIFDYLRKNSIQFDYLEEDKHPYIGYHYLTDKDGKLTKIILFVPYVDNYHTVLINIHEYIHGIILYNKLGKKIKNGKDIEILPLLYETLYLLENPNKSLQTFHENLNKRITENSPIEYKIALDVQKEMLHYYHSCNPNFNKLKVKAKKLARRYKDK